MKGAEKRKNALSFVYMSKLRPVPKNCQVKSPSLDYMANEVPVDLRGWVAVAESPDWFAWPNCPATKKNNKGEP